MNILFGIVLAYSGCGEGMCVGLSEFVGLNTRFAVYQRHG